MALKSGEMCVCDLAAFVGVTESAVSHQLRRLRDLAHDYRDFPAHYGLWHMARRTAQDSLVRMARVPRVLEARGLDVTPGMIRRLRDIGDSETVEDAEYEVIDEDAAESKS